MSVKARAKQRRLAANSLMKRSNAQSPAVRAGLLCADELTQVLAERACFHLTFERAHHVVCAHLLGQDGLGDECLCLG